MTEKQTSIEWHALEFKPHRKSAMWFTIYVLLAAALIAYGVYAHNLLTLITFILLVGVGFFYSIQRPREIRYRLTPEGAIANHTLYPYKNIKLFWIVYASENKTINFLTTAYLNGLVSFELGSQDPVSVRNFLKQYIQEDLDKDESMTDVIARKIKF